MITRETAGTLIARLGYKPYGLTAWSTAELPAQFGYTGQRYDSGDGWIYDYGARFYDEYIGRFISADTIVPQAGNPQALNRYAYALGNPLRYTDPTGHCFEPISFAICSLGATVVTVSALAVDVAQTPKIDGPRTSISPDVVASGDMTAWLLEQMRVNATSPIVESIREHCCTNSPADTLGAMKAWVALVKRDAVWDFKRDIHTANLPSVITLGGRSLNYQSVANIHYGFVGRAAGYKAEFLKAGAGAIQFANYIGSDRSKIGPADKYFDQPFDAWSVQLGIFLFEKYKDNLDGLTPESFAETLDEYIDKYGEPPPADN